MRYLFLFFLLFSTTTFAGIGTITEQEGKTDIQRQKSSLPGNKGSEVEMMDVIVTLQGKSSITFKDDTKVNVTENSKLVIDDFVYDPKSKGAGKLAIKVALGTVRYASGQIAHDDPNKVKIDTPTSTIAVRGTDFVMSVDEIGRSVIVLMPQCDKDGICIDGAIDVITPAGMVSMTKPYQATLVENQNNRPSPPILIKLEPTQVNNNIIVSSPKTQSGQSLIEKAREAIKEAQKSTQEKTAEKNTNPSTGISGITSEQESQITQQSTVTVTQTKPDNVVPVQKSTQEIMAGNTHITPIMQKQIQIGWQYFNMSESKNESATIILPKNTLVQIVVVQDLTQDTFQFANKPGGYITIRQNQK